MKRFLLAVCLGGALASCAPTMMGSLQGRIVNAKTGEEGTVAFDRGSLRPRADAAFAPDNARIQIGGQMYAGRTLLIDSAAAGPVAFGFDVSFGVPLWRDAQDAGWGFGGSARPTPLRIVSRSGNLIARTPGPQPRTLTCTLVVDAQEHGTGDCTGEDGTRYVMQF